MLPFGRSKHIKDVYIPLVIKKRRESRQSEKISKRHEIYDVHLEKPEDAISNIEEIFNLKNDKNEAVKRILIVGRPGIGKSVLSTKILYNSITSSNTFYKGKIVILIKFRNLNSEQRKTLTLRDMLLTGLSDCQNSEIIYQYITTKPRKSSYYI